MGARPGVKICSRCVLPTNFPGISFDKDGVCNFCQNALPPSRVLQHFEVLRENMAKAIESVRGKGAYDCIVAFSGGKDSSYALKLLVEQYRLRCLAVTIDNGFMSKQARRNCRIVTEALGVDFLMFRPAPRFMNDLYLQSARNSDIHAKSAIKRASSMCNSCINLINTYMIKLALQNNAPIIAGGYIGGQVPKDAAILQIDLSILSRTRESTLQRYTQHFGPDARYYFEIEDSLIQGLSGKLTIINPMLTVHVTEERIIEDIAMLGWKQTTDTGRNSSNCQLNDLGIVLHFKQYGFNPYVFEIAEQVRSGLMDRDVAIEKAYSIPETKQVLHQARQIGLDSDEI